MVFDARYLKAHQLHYAFRGIYTTTEEVLGTRSEYCICSTLLKSWIVKKIFLSHSLQGDEQQSRVMHENQQVTRDFALGVISQLFVCWFVGSFAFKCFIWQ